MEKFIYFKNPSDVLYPVGEHFKHNFDFIREAAYSINKIFPTGKLILVVRGHSGSILAGSIAYLLRRKKREVLISVSRKAESSHSYNLEGISSCIVKYEEVHIIVVDDFVCTGETIRAILKDLTDRLDVKEFDMLVISNYWDKDNLTSYGGKRGVDRHWESNRGIVSHFRYILCNNPKYAETL